MGAEGPFCVSGCSVVVRKELTQLLSCTLGYSSKTIDAYAVECMGELFGDSPCPVPCALLGTVLVLDEHFGPQWQRCQGPCGFVRLLPLGEEAVPVRAFFQLPRLSPCGLDRFVAELVCSRHKLEGVC